MCARIYVTLSWDRYRKLFDLSTSPPESNFQPNWNGAPTHDILVCAARDGARSLVPMRWGLAPAWAKEPPKYATINAMCESLEDKPTWRGSLNGKRCVVAVDGFYEWRGPKGEKQPFVIRRRDGEPMLLAGLWAFNDKIEPRGLYSFAIVTCAANAFMGRLHNRMPVILSAGDIAQWLGPDPWSGAVRDLMRPCPDDWLEAYPVDKRVGNVRLNGPDLIDPIGPPLA